MDQAMGALDAAVGRFTGQRLGAVDTSGYLANALVSVDDQINEINGDIADMQVRLGEREAYLTQQYAEMQAQLMSLAYAQQSWSSIYGSVNSLY
jgi:flagellar capping protein FliD